MGAHHHHGSDEHSHDHSHDHDNGKSHSHGHHHDGHGHHHHVDISGQGFNRAFAIATMANLAFTLIEAGYAVVAHSTSLLADAGHNLGDVMGLLFAWIASYLLTKPSTDRYSYGFKRTSILAALANALLLVATCSIIVYEAIYHIVRPEHVNTLTVMIVALIGILVNGGTAMLFMKGQDDLNIRGAFLHLAGDALVSFGVVIAAIVIHYTGWFIVDPIAGLGIVAIILISTWRLLRHSLDMILDAVPYNVDRSAVLAYLKTQPDVAMVHDLHIWSLSTNETAMTAHLIIPTGTPSDNEYARMSDDLRKQFRINHVTLQVELGDTEAECAHEQEC